MKIEFTNADLTAATLTRRDWPWFWRVVQACVELRDDCWCYVDSGKYVEGQYAEGRRYGDRAADIHNARKAERARLAWIQVWHRVDQGKRLPEAKIVE